jgi:hypothetical protein
MPSMFGKETPLITSSSLACVRNYSNNVKYCKKHSIRFLQLLLKCFLSYTNSDTARYTLQLLVKEKPSVSYSLNPLLQIKYRPIRILLENCSPSCKQSTIFLPTCSFFDMWDAHVSPWPSLPDRDEHGATTLCLVQRTTLLRTIPWKENDMRHWWRHVPELVRDEDSFLCPGYCHRNQTWRLLWM